MPTTPPPPGPLAEHFVLDPTIAFLNHGSYGACPRRVLEEQSRIRAHMEREPVEFFMVDMERQMDEARGRLAAWLGCDAAGLVPVPNATTGVATALWNHPLELGDEILVNDHEYSACISEAKRLAKTKHLTVREVSLPWPVQHEDQIVDALLEGVTPKTKLAILSWITSPTAIVLPAARLVREFRARGVEVILDGAHAPGQIDVDIESVSPAYFTANMHKWPCAPKGSGVLWIAPKYREGFEPLVLSARAHLDRPDRSRLLALFDYTGTSDYTAFLTAPAAVDIISEIGGGWDAIRAHNASLARRGRDIICERLGIEPPAPDTMLGTMASLVLPGDGLASGGTRPGGYEDPLQERLVRTHRVQVPVWSLPSRRARMLRISAQIYNTEAQYAHLADALAEELAAHA